VDRAIQALANDPSAMARARLSLAYSQKYRDDPDPVWLQRAESEANAAIAREPNLAQAHIALGTAALRAGRLDAAESGLARALDLNPRDATALRRLAQVREGRKRLAEAEPLYRRAVELAPSDWQTHQALAFFLQSRGRYAEARETYLKALDLTPDNYALHRDLGSTYWYLERYDDAAASFQRALELRPSATVSNNLGVVLYFRGRYAEAAAAFEKAVELGANNYVHWGNLGDAQVEVAALRDRASESWTRARQLAEERLSREPNDEAAAAGLALYFARLGDKRAALDRVTTLEKGPALKPGTDYLLTLASEAAGDRSRALRHLEAALRAGYGSTEARSNPTLLTLRSDPAYHRMLARLEKR
jgi:Tfp pilus assembly protein PilF